MQQQQGPPPMLAPMQAQLPPTNNVSTEVIQKYLDENKQLILAIMDNQNLGKLAECAQYQARLQNNLLYLAAIADAQSQIAATRPQQQGVQYMQPQANFSPRGSSQQFTLQQYQEQTPHGHHQMNHPQILPTQGHMGMPAVNNGVHVINAEGSLGGNRPPSTSPHEFVHGGPGSSFDGRGHASVLELTSRNSATEQKASEVEK